MHTVCSCRCRRTSRMMMVGTVLHARPGGWLCVHRAAQENFSISPRRAREVTTALWRVAATSRRRHRQKRRPRHRPSSPALRAILSRPPTVLASPSILYTYMMPGRGRRPEAELGAALTSREAEEAGVLAPSAGHRNATLVGLVVRCGGVVVYLSRAFGSKEPWAVASPRCHLTRRKILGLGGRPVRESRSLTSHK